MPEEGARMSPQPTRSRTIAERRNRALLAERFRAWRSRPRIDSPQWYWSLLGVAVLLDAAALTLAICLLLLSPSFAAPAVLRAGSRCPAWALSLVAAVLFAFRSGVRTVHPWLGRALTVLGLTACLVVGVRAGTPTSGPGPAAWVNWAAGAVLVAALLLEGGSRQGVFVFSGAGMATLGLLLAAGLPADGSLPTPGDLLAAGGIAGGRTIAVVGGVAAYALAWACANLALSLTVVTPTRRALIRMTADGAYRALAVAVLLLTIAAFLGHWPPQALREIVFFSVWTLLVLLLHARFAGWVQDIGLTVCCSLLGGLLVAGGGAWAAQQGAGPAVLGWLCVAVVANASLILHALHRYWFDCPEKLA
jgi:hypothetical protein